MAKAREAVQGAGATNPPLTISQSLTGNLAEALLVFRVTNPVPLTSAEAAYGRLQSVAGRVTPRYVAATTEARLREAGLTRQKAAYCHALARALLAGTLDLAAIAKLSDEAVRAIMLQLPGVGPWTADIYLLMALRRTDVWPVGDLALARAAQRQPA